MLGQFNLKFSHDPQRVCHQFYSHHHGGKPSISQQNIYQCKLYRNGGRGPCSMILLPQEMYHISLGPSFSNGYKLDYGLGLNANYSNLLTLNYTGTDTIRAKAYYTLVHLPIHIDHCFECSLKDQYNQYKCAASL